MADFDDEFEEIPEEDRLSQEAEDLMRQGRFQDAVKCYSDLHHRLPADPWAMLGYASALECNGQIREAAQVVEEITTHNRHNRHVQRFSQLFYERREDPARAQRCQEVLQSWDTGFDDSPGDQLAELYFNQGRYHEANAELQRILREEAPDDEQSKASVLARVGACHRQNGALDEALDCLLRAQQLDPGNHWIVSELAETERSLGDIDRARASYEEALQLEDSDGWTRGRLANLEFEQGNSVRAVALYEQVMMAEPRAIWPRVELAQVLAEQEPERAAELCQQALELDATYPWAYAQLAMLARQEERFDEARRLLQQALTNAPQSLWLLHELADVCRLMGRSEEAYTHLDHAFRLAPYDATTYGYMADFLRGDNRNDEACAYLTKAVELDDDYTWAWRELCELHAIAGRHEQAEASFLEVEELEPDEPINDGLRAFLLRYQGKRDAALPYLQRAVDRQPEYLWAWRELIDYYLQSGRWAASEQACEQALDHLSRNTGLLGMLAESRRRQGKRQEAIQAIDTALNIDNSIAQLWAMRAELVLPDNRAEALQAAYKACDHSDAPEYRVLLLQCLIAHGKHSKARAMLPELCGRGELPAVSPIPFELAADYAEHDRDRLAAISACDQGLERFPDSIRLQVRRCRLGLDVGEANALDRLRPLLDHPGPLPWHDIIPLFARGRDLAAVRRCAYRNINACAGDAEAAARAWLVLAESLLLNGLQTEARDALQQSLALAPDLVPARLLVSMLLDQAGEHQRAIEHLLHVKALLDAERDDGEKPLEQVALLQQIASLCERAGDHAAASHYWQELRAADPQRRETALDHHCFQLRRGENEAGALGLAALIADPSTSDEVLQRALYQLSIHEVQAQRSAEALVRLLAHEERLSVGNRMLCAQCALLESDAATCQRLLDGLDRNQGLEPAQRDLLCRLRIRLLLGQRRIDEALARARSLAGEGEVNEHNAVLHAECLVADRRLGEALGVLDDERLPQQPNLERLLWGACLRLELHDEAQAFAWLGRNHDAADPDHPLVRLLHSAWPLAWGPGQRIPTADGDDCIAVPLLLNCAERIAKALATQGHRDLAASLHLHLAQRAVLADQPYTARICQRRAAVHLRACGQLAAARQAAREGHDPLLWLRCLLP